MTKAKAKAATKPRRATKAFTAANQNKQPAQVAVIRLRGVVAPLDEGEGPFISWDKYRDTIIKAFDCKETAAVVLDMECPGGSVAETELLASEIRRQADRTKKLVYAFARGSMASGGYWIACAADMIFALPTSSVGSIGVRMDIVNESKRDKMKGYQYVTLTAGQNKNELDTHKPFKPAELARAREELKYLHNEFITWVAARRGEALKGTAESWATGECWFGRQALEKGLVDGVGHMMDILPKLLNRPVVLKEFSEDKSREETLRKLTDLLEQEAAAASARKPKKNVRRLTP